MYCPRCGQQQASEALRYCSRCGFPLEGVGGLLAGGGLVPAVDDERDGPLTPRQRGTRKGLMIVAGGVLFFALAFFMTLIKDDFFVLMLPAAILIIVGVMRALYGVLLEADRDHSKKLKGTPEAAIRELDAASAQTLPPARPFQSVTESTTRLLEEEEPSRRRGQ